MDPPARADVVRQPTATDRRIPMFDAMRFFAAIAIVWQHTPESAALQRYGSLSSFAVPFFVLGSVLFVFEGVSHHPGKSFGDYLAARVRRIYVPFLVWTVIYLVVRELKHRLLTRDESVGVSPLMLLGGSAHHLWFLPYLLVLSLVTFCLARMLRNRPAMQKTVALACGAAGVLCGLLPMNAFASNYLLDRAYNMLPAALWGIAIGTTYPAWPRGLWGSRLITFAGLVVCAAGAILTLSSYRTILSDNLAGLGLLLVGLQQWRTRAITRAAAWGGLAYGIYLSHVLFVEGAQSVAQRAGLSPNPMLDVSVFTIGVVGGVATAMWLARVRWGRWLVPA